MKKLQRITACLLALAICMSVLTIQVSASPAVSDIDNGIMAKWVTGPDGYDDGFGMNNAGGSDKAQKMLNGDRFVRYDNHGFWNARTSLPVGSYYFKFMVKIKRGSDTSQINEDDRPFFVSIPGDNERADRSGPVLKAFPDDEWITVSIPFVIGNNLAHRNIEYAIKGAMPWIIGGNDAECYISREIVVSTNNEPLVYHGAVASYAMQGGYGDVVTAKGTINDDRSRTYTGQDAMYEFKATLPEGQYWAKLITRTSGKNSDANLTGEISRFTSSAGLSANLPAVGEYDDGKWKNVIIPFTVNTASAGKEITYSISGPQNGAKDLTIEEYILICDNGRPLSTPQQTWRDKVLTAAQLANGIGVSSNNYDGTRTKFNASDGYLELKSTLSKIDRFIWDLEMRLSRKQFADSGYMNAGKAYIKVLAKVPTLASQTLQNETLFSIEMRSGGDVVDTASFNYGVFTEADTYQTLVYEFDTTKHSSFGGSGEWTVRFDGRFFPGISDLQIKSITISATPDVTDKTTSITNGIIWPDDQQLPSFGTPADTLELVDIRDGTDITYRSAMTCLQGLVNKKQPRIICAEATEEGEGNGYNLNNRDYWPASLGLNYVHVEGNSTNERILKMIKKYSDEIDGFILYSGASNNYNDLNIATTIGGIYNAVPVTKAILDVLRANPYDMDATRWPVIRDISTQNFGSGNSSSNITNSRVAAYNYLYDNYSPANAAAKGNLPYNDRIITIISPSGPESTSSTHSGHFAIRDLAIATASPVVWLNSNNTSQSTVLNKYFNDMKNAHNNGLGAIAMGFWPSEEQGVKAATSYGITSVPSDNFENYTVYSGMSRIIDPTSVPKKPDLVGGVNYISLATSDGDNIAYLEHGMRYGQRTGDRTRGYYPINWTMTPALLDAAPQMLQYYYNTATENDCYIIGPDGYGYTRSESWPSTTVDVNGESATWIQGYAALTNSYVERTGLNYPTIWGCVLNWNGSTSGTHYNTLTQAKFEQYVDFKYFPSLAGLYHLNATTRHSLTQNEVLRSENSDVMGQWFNFGHYAGSGTNGGALGNTSSAASTTSSGTVYGRIKGLSQTLDNDTNTFNAVQVQNWLGDLVSNINSLQDYSNKNYSKNEFVRSDHYFMLMAEANGEPINNALQADTYASASDSGYEPGKAVDGSFGKSHGWKSSEDGDKWLTVDFGKRQTITRYVVKNAELAGYPASYNTKGWELQVSNDGRNWTAIDVVTDNTDATVYRTATSESARFARIYITDAGEDGIARIQDIEIYGINNWDRATLTYTTYKDELNAEIDNFDIDALNQLDYTDVTWQALVDALANAVSVAANDAVTQIEIDNATLALRDAVAGLDAIDLTALDAALEEAETKVKDEFSAASWALFQNALTEAQAIKTASQTIPMTLTQSQIDTAVTNLINAMNSLSLDRTELQDSINIANELVETDYSIDSWEILQKALQKANNVYNDLAATKDAIAEANNELLEAISALTVDKTELLEVITALELIDSKYCTTLSWNAFMDTLEKARAINTSDSVKQSEIDSVITELYDAIEGLVSVEDVFNAIKSEIEELLPDDYVPDSWNKVTQMCDEMEALLNSDDYTHDQINKLLDDLVEAIDDLLLAIKNLPSAIELTVGEDITFTPTPNDGEWEWDKKYFDTSFNSSAVFTALDEGKTIITYTTSQGVTHTINVTIRKDDINPPQTGDEIPY